MTQITFVQQDGNRFEVNAEEGASLMQAAINNMVPGIVGECGGVCSCATCHMHIPAGWSEKLTAPSDMEQMILEGAVGVTGDSRLGCQVVVEEWMDGMVVNVPESQF